jgi:hypothetical protein
MTKTRSAYVGGVAAIVTIAAATALRHAVDVQAGRCGEKVTCWPAPENPETMNRRHLGNLKLSD